MAPTPRTRLIPFLTALAIALAGFFWVHTQQESAGPPEPTDIPSSEPLEPGPAPPHDRRPSDYLSPDNLTHCPDDDVPTARNLVIVTFAPATSERARARILRHLRADVMPYRPGDSTLTFVLALPGAVDCPTRAAAIIWLEAQPTVRSARPYAIMPKV